MENKSFSTATVYTLKNMVEYSENSTVSKIITRHTAPFDAIVQILEGTGHIIINKKEYEVNEGEFIIMPANIPHALEARSKFKMLLTMIKA